MSLSTNTVWEVRTAGADDNGGGFVTGAAGTDYSQSNTKRTATGTDDSTTDAVANGTTTITSATANFQASIVGNIICLQGGTGALTKGWYQVTARASATNITVDRNVAAGTGITMNIGGALASLGMVGGATPNNSNYIWIKAGTYTITSASFNVSGGCFNSSLVTVFIEGYNTVRGDLGTKPLLQTNGVITNFTMINQGSNGAQFIRNLSFDGNSRTSSKGVDVRGQVWYCDFQNFTNGACVDSLGANALAFNCSATGCSSVGAFSAISCFNCVSYNNTANGFDASVANSFYSRCIAYGNSGATSDGFNCAASTGRAYYTNCTSYGNGRNGFNLQETRGIFCLNCIAEANGGTGFVHNANNVVVLHNCGAFNNTTANFNIGTHAGSLNISSVTGVSSFFTNAGAQDFSLNNTAGAGAALRAAGVPGQIPNLTTTTGYLDIGAFQHQDTGGGGGGESSSVFG